MEIEKLKDIVQEALVQDARNRESDTWLIINVLRKMGFKIFIDYGEIESMPCFESITRCRRKLQEENEQLRASPETEDLREKKREELRSFFKPSSRGVIVENIIVRKRGIEI